MSPPERGRFSPAEIVVGLVLLGLAAVIAWDAFQLEAGQLYGVGPAAAPLIVAGGLVLLGLATLAAALRQIPSAERGEARGEDHAAVIVMVAALAVVIAIVAFGGGFVAACTVLFAGTAWAFGRRKPLADIAIGCALALVTYLAFTKLLRLGLPQGPLERLF